MDIYRWDKQKNEQLKKERGMSFEEVVIAISEKGLLDDYDHPNRKKYPNQRVYEVEIRGYICLVPHVVSDRVIFLKTIIPSRKANKKHQQRRDTL